MHTTTRRLISWTGIGVVGMTAMAGYGLSCGVLGI
ncbi:unnamed protein product [Spirodela intermedia]|uniref:Uncharacterized protein n=2 Tax=Spirodela intermedia TaxID=51605 RepID=A0A7I8IUJ1_SPIIN|nr:unnamed protein product [Spirodela intermedia]CAA6661211.1 unnamed protein product [Spirodela intermedia]CAA7397570.1 unnamed protein product [Spirodela intermedia]